MNLNELRLEIDKIDDQLVQLFAQRMEVSARIADYKKAHDLPIFVPSREAEKLRDVAQKSGEDMQVYTRVLYDLLFELSRGYQSKRNAARTPLFEQISAAIGCTGPMLPSDATVACPASGTDMDLVCRRILGPCGIISFKNQEGILSAVAQGMCRYGILPLEGSRKGLYDALSHHQLYIVRALHLQDGSEYLCVSKQLEIYPGADRATICMALSDRPGALYKVLARLYTLGINVISLESRPIVQQNFQGMFYFELETSIYSEAFARLMCELGDLCENFSYLGSFTEVV